MRIFLGWVCLLFLFGVAGYVHQHWTAEKREERSLLRGEGEGGSSHILIGGASDAEPLDVGLEVPEQENLPPAPEVEAAAGPEGRPPEDWTPPVFEVRVQPGQVLSKICAKHYGRATPELVSGVAAYNGLANPDQLKVGQKILLPDRSVLPSSEPTAR